MLPGPCQPIPITPRLMRLLGACCRSLRCGAAKNCGKNGSGSRSLQKATAIERPKEGFNPDCCGITYPNITSYGRTEMIYITFDRQFDFATAFSASLSTQSNHPLACFAIFLSFVNTDWESQH